MDDLIIQYQGFSPTQFAQNHVRSLMQKIHDESPASSALRVSIAKVGEHAFKGFVKISSQAGQFFIQASGSGLMDLAHLLRERTRRRLEKWKHRRFRDHRVGRLKHATDGDSFSQKDKISFRGNYENAYD